jgi:opacity protein-like surface antigen
VWRAPGTSFDAKVHAGYTHGAYSIAANRTSVDWSAGVGFRPARNIRLGLEYFGIGGPRVKNYGADIDSR